MKSVALAAAGLLLPLCACGGWAPTIAPSNLLQPPSVSVRQLVRDSRASACRTLDDPNDPTFSELNGINNSRVIVGNNGSGGYAIRPPYRQSDYSSADYPGATATVVTSLSDAHVMVGFYNDGKGDIRAFIESDGRWSSYKGPSNLVEYLGINGRGIVGFFTDKHSIDRGFELGRKRRIHPPGGISVVAAGINNKDNVVGYMTKSDGSTASFLLTRRIYTEFQYPGSTRTEAFGINAQDEIVGFYVDPAGTTHGFLLSNPTTDPRWHSFDEPKAVGLTVVRGINDHGDLVGYYLDSSGNTNGFLCE
ncbi:MAG: hypothetical protein ABSD52_14130 [Candidatus Cybelea sp.]